PARAQRRLRGAVERVRGSSPSAGGSSAVRCLAKGTQEQLGYAGQAGWGWKGPAMDLSGLRRGRWWHL
ncbi:Hypothetical predicted protein, partial [Marmota monax]